MPRTMTAANYTRLRIEAVRARAERAGFNQVATFRNGLAALLVAPAPDGKSDIELALPLEPTIGDYIARMADAVEAIAAAEDNEPLDVLRDLLTASEQI